MQFSNDGTATAAGGIVLLAIVILIALNRGFGSLSAGIKVGV